jgi:hypothetical protein
MARKITYDPNRDYYSVLGIDIAAAPDEIRRAYRQAVRAVHPDLHPREADWATQQIQLLNEAYSVLSRTAARREYDRLRWLHLPGARKQPESGTRAPFARSDYNPNRPWWTPPPFSAAYSDDPLRAARGGYPVWLTVSAWLRAHHLGALQSTWLTLVGLWRSPYSGILSLLSLVLALNVAFIVYAVITPDDNRTLLDELRLWMGGQAETAGVETPAPTATPDRLYRVCEESGAQITQPVNYDTVGDLFSVYGSVLHPEMWNYTLEIGYLGLLLQLESVPSQWELVRPPPANQSSAEPVIENDLLSQDPVDLTGRVPGYYAIRLRVYRRDGSALQPCDVIVRR